MLRWELIDLCDSTCSVCAVSKLVAKKASTDVVAKLGQLARTVGRARPVSVR